MKSINLCQSVIQTIYDTVKAHGGVPIAIGMKVETLSAEATAQAGKEGDGSEFIIQLRTN